MPLPGKPVIIQRRYRHSVLAWLHLTRLHTRIAREEQRTLSQFGLTPAQFDVLAHIASEPGLNQQALAERLLVTKGNVNGLIDRLETAKLVERRADPDDRRVYRLHLTPLGAKTFEAAAPALEATLDRQFSSLREDEKGALMTLVARLDRALSRNTDK